MMCILNKVMHILGSIYSGGYQCIIHLDYHRHITNVSKEVDFDTLIDTTTSIHIILLNEDEWESSSFSCAWWHKNKKCNHTIFISL